MRTLAAALFVLVTAAPASGQSDVLPASFVVVDDGVVVLLDTQGHATILASGLDAASAVSASPNGDSIAVAVGGSSAGEGRVVLIEPGRGPVTIAENVVRPSAVAQLRDGGVVFAAGSALWLGGNGEVPDELVEFDANVAGLVALGDDGLVAVLEGGAVRISGDVVETVTGPLLNPGQPAFDAALGLCIPEEGQIRCWDLDAASVTTVVDVVGDSVAVAVVDGLLVVASAGEGILVVDPATNQVVGGGLDGLVGPAGIARLDAGPWVALDATPSTSSSPSTSTAATTAPTTTVQLTAPESTLVAVAATEPEGGGVQWSLVGLIIGAIVIITIAGVTYALRAPPR